MKRIFTKQFLCWTIFSVLCLFMIHSVTFAQETADDALKTKYAPILGEYEFVMEGGPFFLKFYIESGDFWADSGDGRPATMESLGDKLFEFTAEDPQAGIFEIKFLKDDKGDYTICHVVNTGMGLDAKGNKIV